jgi:outer membrane protein assembly factor BamB
MSLSPSSIAFCLISLLSALTAQEPQSFDRLKVHASPKALSAKAKTSDWPRLLGPSHDVHCPETNLLHDWGATGPTKLWEVEKGDGYTSPVVVGDRCVIFHALDQRETVECLNAETGKRYWMTDYAIEYQDRLGYANGPRGSAVIGGDCVITLGVTSVLQCLDLRTGKQLWQHDLAKLYQVPQEFFGHGSTPLIMDGRAYVNVGGKGEKIDGNEDPRDRLRKLTVPGVCVAAFDLATGKSIWELKDSWGASYAIPIMTILHGQPRLLVFAGGESNPAIGGLLCIDPADGKVFDRIDWRADMYTSVNATSPVVIAEKNRVLLTTAYPKGKPIGSLMLEFNDQWKAKEVWRSPGLACHWMNPIYRDGHLYAVSGETEQQAELVCFQADDGKEKWRTEISWEQQVKDRPYRLGLMRASLLQVDGATLCLGETGSLHWLELTPEGAKASQRHQLWLAPHTWSLPVISKGLLYVAQHDRDQVDGTPQRFVCYDLRGE